MKNNHLNKQMDTYMYTSIGGRDVNEDTCTILNKMKNDYCFIVADGLGGHGGGAQASQTAVTSISTSYLNDNLQQPDGFNIWFQKANQEVVRLQSLSCEMKTTLVTLNIKDDFAMWAHVGDSRLYHFVENKIKEQTFDHSVSQMAVLRGEIKQEEIREHVDRNRLLRALGRNDEIKIEVSEKTNLIGEKHAFLLCTDGFWEYVYEKEMEEALVSSTSAENWINIMKEYVKKRSKEGNDNNTAVAVIYYTDKEK